MCANVFVYWSVDDADESNLHLVRKGIPTWLISLIFLVINFVHFEIMSLSSSTGCHTGFHGNCGW